MKCSNFGPTKSVGLLVLLTLSNIDHSYANPWKGIVRIKTNEGMVTAVISGNRLITVSHIADGNNHPKRDFIIYEIKYPDGDILPLKYVLGFKRDTTNDVGVFKLGATFKVETLPIASSDEVENAKKVFYRGWQPNKFLTRVNRSHRLDDDYIYLNMRSTKGNSGGAYTIFTDRRKLAAVHRGRTPNWTEAYGARLYEMKDWIYSDRGFTKTIYNGVQTAVSYTGTVYVNPKGFVKSCSEFFSGL